jgi:hypothetical protein
MKTLCHPDRGAASEVEGPCVSDFPNECPYLIPHRSRIAIAALIATVITAFNSRS